MIFQYHYNDAEVQEYFKQLGFNTVLGSEERPAYKTHSRNEYTTVTVPMICNDSKGTLHNANEVFSEVLNLKCKAFGLSKTIDEKQEIINILNK